MEGVVEIKHCKAHRSLAAIALLDHREAEVAKGNRRVDIWAKEGASLDAGFGRDQACQQLGEKGSICLEARGAVACQHGSVGRCGEGRKGPAAAAERLSSRWGQSGRTTLKAEEEEG